MKDFKIKMKAYGSFIYRLSYKVFTISPNKVAPVEATILT